MKRRNEVLVGVFVTIAVIVGIFGTLWLARRGFGGSTYPLHTRFAWGAALKKGQQVLLAGVQVGVVDKVELRRDGYLDVTLSINDDYSVPEGTRSSVRQISLFGDMAVALNPPKPPIPEASVPPGDTIPAAEGTVGLDALLARADTVTASVADVAESFEIQMVKDGGIRDLRAAIGATNRLITQLNAIAAEQSRGISATLASMRRTTNAIDSAAVDSTVRNIQSATRNMDQITTDLRETTTKLNAVLAKIETGDGTAAKLINDPGLYNDMRMLLGRLDSLTADFKKNPRRYINLEIF